MLTLALPAHAVDGAGLQWIDVFAVLVLLLAAAAPFIMVGGAVLLLMCLVRSSRRREQTVALPPSVAEVRLAEEETELMLRWNIFFNGSSYRLGERLYGTLAEAVVDAKARAEANDAG